MVFEIHTIVLILGISHLMQVLVFFYQYSYNRNVKGPGWWLIWSAVESLGFLLMSVRNLPGIHIAAIVFQNLLIFAGTIFIYIGVMKFFDRKINARLILIFFSFFALIHLFLIFVKDDIVLRSILISSAISVTSFITAFSIYKYKSSPVVLTANLNTAIFIIHGGIFAFRTIMIISGVRVSDVFEPSFFNTLPYADALFVSLIWTFGFIMMLNQKLTSEITETKSRFELIFKASPDASVISRLEDGLIIETNDSFVKMTGYQKSEIIDRTVIELQFWRNPFERSQLVSELRSKGYCENNEYQFQRKGGEIFTGLFSGKIISLNGVPHLLSVTRDISERKKADEIIRQKNEELRQSNLEKDKLFSIIAHDLRNPFIGFMGLTDLLVEDLPTMSTEEIQKIVSQMRISSGNLYGLLENLLDWSRVEQGFLRINQQESLLQPLVDESVSKIADFASKKNIKITSTVTEGLKVYYDINIFHTVLRNLLSNSVKFTHKNGEIIISARNNDYLNIEISVKDTGIGMSREMVSNLFRLDAQINRKGTEGEPSTGLGLILCKGFIEAQGGKIWVESEEGKGTTFYFTLPCVV